MAERKKEKSGLDVIMHKGGDEDEVGEGIVGKPSQVEAIQKEGNEGLGKTTLLYGGGLFRQEEAGLEDGVSARKELDPDESEPEYDYKVDPMTGNAPERKVGRANNHEVTGKRGNKFSIGEM